MPNPARLLKKAVNSLLAPLGLRISRVPTGHEFSEAPPEIETHFPTGPVKLGWDVPADFPGSAEAPWQRELRALYADSGSWPASISPEGGWLLYWMIRNIQPRTIVETGTCLGASSIWMAAALQATEFERAKHCLTREIAADPGGVGGAGHPPVLHTFDDFGTPEDQRLAASPLFQDRQRKVSERLERAGVSDLIRLHVGDSKANIPRMHAELAERGGVQFAFIDGDHSAPGAIGDLKAIEPVLNVGGYVLLHDVFPEVCSVDGPRELLDRLADVSPGRYRWCEIYTSPLNYGLALLRRVR